jgi:hypothetical protein
MLQGGSQTRAVPGEARADHENPLDAAPAKKLFAREYTAFSKKYSHAILKSEARCFTDT